MPLLGVGFDFSKPGDDDFVKYGARWIRDTRERLKTWAAVLFNLDTGQLKDNVITSSKLKSISPTPAGTWTRVVVNEKGLVIAGSNPAANSASNIYSALFHHNNGAETDAGRFYDHDLGEWQTVDGSSDGLFMRFTFIVPVGVKQLKVRAWGDGGGGSGNGSGFTGGGGAFVEGIMSVTGGQALLIQVGLGGAGHNSSDASDGAGVIVGSILSGGISVSGGFGATGSAHGAAGNPGAGGEATLVHRPGDDGDDGGAGAGIYVGRPFSATTGNGGVGSPGTGPAGTGGAVVLEYIK